MGFLVPIGMAIGGALSSAGAAVGSMFGLGAAGAAATGASLGGAAAATAAGATAAGSAASASLGFGAAGLALGAAGSIFSGIQAYQQNMFQSKIAAYNSKLAIQNREASLTSGENAEEIQRMRTGKLVGQVAAAQAAGNIDVNVGSAKQLQDSTKLAGEMDALTIRYNAARQAYGYGQEAFSDTLESSVYKQNAKAGLVSGILGAGSSFLSGASSLTGKMAQFQLAGAGGP